MTSIVRFSDLTSRPWPNGRGITRDVANHKSNDGSYDWLISIAELVEDAEFSHYAGSDRIFTLIGANPVDLHVSGLSPLRCNPLVPSWFPGDVPTRCALAGGPSRAFNVIISRARMRGTVSTVVMAHNHRVTLPHRPVAVHCATGTAIVGSELLKPGDTMVDLRNCSIQTGGDSATLLAVVLQPTAQ